MTVRALVPGAEITDILAPYSDVSRPPGALGCWVLANMVGGLDGSAAVAGRVGPLSEGADAELFRTLRSVADVVLVGASTFRLETYGPVVLPEGRRTARQAAGRSPSPPLAVLSGSLDLDWSSRAFGDEASAPTIVITSAADPADRIRTARVHAEVVVAGEARVDLRAALGELGALGHRIVLCEGGPTLLGELVDLGLLDELCLTIAPTMGGDPLPIAVSAASGPLTHFALRHTATDGRSLFLRYERGSNDG